MMVSLYRSEPPGRFHYLSLTGRRTNLLVVRDVVLGSSGREVLSAHELYLRFGTALEMDGAVVSLMETRVRSGFQIIYAYLPETRLPHSARFVRASEPAANPTAWITSYLPPSSAC